MAQSNSWRRSSFTEIFNANRVILFKSEAADWLIVIWSHFHYFSHEFFVRFICARCSLSSLSRYKYLESSELSVQLKLDQFSDWLTYYYILSTHVNLSIRITFILSIKYWLYTWSKQSNPTHCQLNSQEFSKRISFFVTMSTRLKTIQDMCILSVSFGLITENTNASYIKSAMFILSNWYKNIFHQIPSCRVCYSAHLSTIIYKSLLFLIIKFILQKFSSGTLIKTKTFAITLYSFELFLRNQHQRFIYYNSFIYIRSIKSIYQSFIPFQ